MWGTLIVGRDVRTGFRAAALGCAFAVALVASSRAQNVIDINPNDVVGPVPASAGTGLFGQYYNFQSVTTQIPNLETAASLVAGSNGPIATFLSNGICFPECDFESTVSDDTSTLVDFLNGHATNINLTGYIAITQPGQYLFELDSDDGSRLSIDSQVIAQGDRIQSIASGFSYGYADFSAPGLYKLAVNFFENNGGSALDLLAYDPNFNCLLGCEDDNGNLIPSPLLYNDGDLQGAPAPAIGVGWPALVVLAAFGTVSAARRPR